jgi:hypothetical protein
MAARSVRVDQEKSVNIIEKFSRKRNRNCKETRRTERGRTKVQG